MSSQIISKPLPYIALILSHLIWGANFVVAKVTLQEIPPSSLALLRFAFASLFLAPFLLAETKKVRIKKEDLPRLISIGVLMITLNISFFFAGITKTTATAAATLTLIIPFTSVLFSWWFLKEKVYLLNLAGILIGLAGAVIIVGLPQLLLGNFTPQVLVGNLLIILASLSWVVGAIVSRQVLKKYPSLTVTGIAFIVGTITFILPAYQEYLLNPTWISKVSALGALGLTYMTFLSSISAYFLFEWGLARTSVIKADLFQYIEPLIAALLAVSILGEKITVPFLVGAVLIATGVYLGTLAKEAHHRHKIHRV